MAPQAITAGLFAAAVRAPRRRVVRAAGASLLFRVVAFGWFFEHPLVWGVLAAITAAVVVSARGWNHVRVA